MCCSNLLVIKHILRKKEGERKHCQAPVVVFDAIFKQYILLHPPLIYDMIHVIKLIQEISKTAIIQNVFNKSIIYIFEMWKV